MLRFKTSEIEKQFYLLPVHNRRLKHVLEMTATFCDLEFKKDVVVTEIYRDAAQNAAVGGIPNSPHMNWEAADLRSSTFSDEQLTKLKTWLNFLTFRNGKQTCVVHAVPGGAFHVHCQVAK